MILVTGGSGFIGSNFVLDWNFASEALVNLDKLTYAGNPHNLDSIKDKTAYAFVKGDIADRDLVRLLLRKYQPRAIINFAAESHVDRSIHGPVDFIQTNIVGTFNLLEEVRMYWTELPDNQHRAFRFLHVSTDEVYGSLGREDPAFTESTAYAPNSPYSASKAASDHLVRAYYHTYGLPTFTTNCSNNYGPYQFPEKFIPLMIHNALHCKPLPVYGDGMNIRDWIYVADHCTAIRLILARGLPGEVYNIGGNNEQTNLDVVRMLCTILDQLLPNATCRPHESLIDYVQDRPGHDKRFAINADKIRQQLGWNPHEAFSSGLHKTVEWYLQHQDWMKQVTSGIYREWITQHYGKSK